MNRQAGRHAAPTSKGGIPYRLLYVGLGLIAVAAIALAVAFGGGGQAVELPEVVESLGPLPGESALSQAALEVDLQSGFLAQIYIDGFPIPGSEVTFVEATGVHRWQPAPNSLVFDRWSPGEHVVRIVWDRLAGLPQPGEFSWTFRVQ